MYLTPKLKGFPLELGAGVGVKNRMMELAGQKRSLTISSAVWLRYMIVTDGQIDGHRPTAKTALTHSVAR